MQLIYHKENKGIMAELLPEEGLKIGPDEIMDLMAEAGMNDAAGIIIHQGSLHQDFFDLKTRVAGEILQKFSNYRMRLAIVGDFSAYESKSLKDFIRESNRYGIIRFVGSVDDALI
jgi:hypothetical protein